MNKNIIITAINSYDKDRKRDYFDSVMTLIDTVHRYAFDLIEGIYIYDLGIEREHINTLNKIKNVSIVQYPYYLNYFFDEYLDPRYYAYKMFSLKDAQRYGSNILWLDAGICLTNKIDPIFDIIENDHVFLVKDPSHKNEEFTSKECREIMNPTSSELNSYQLCSGVTGYKSGGDYQWFIDNAFEFSKIRKCVVGSSKDHRWDQSIYSILQTRHNLPTQPLYKYGEHRGKDIHPDQLLYVHRTSYKSDRTNIKCK